MGAAETIAAAIEKLEYLRDEATGNGVAWEAEAGPESGEAQVFPADSDSAHAWTARGTDAILIVTLHRTIDAQLVILRHDLEILPKYGEHGLTQSWESAVERAGDRDLARAILGEVS